MIAHAHPRSGAGAGGPPSFFFGGARSAALPPIRARRFSRDTTVAQAEGRLAVWVQAAGMVYTRAYAARCRATAVYLPDITFGLAESWLAASARKTVMLQCGPTPREVARQLCACMAVLCVRQASFKSTRILGTKSGHAFHAGLRRARSRVTCAPAWQYCVCVSFKSTRILGTKSGHSFHAGLRRARSRVSCALGWQ